MKFITHTIILVCLLALKLSATAFTITGKVTDAVTNEPLPGAIISIPELRQTVTTNENGDYTFTRIPKKGRFLVEVRYIGFKTITQIVDLSLSAPINFSLQTSVIEVHEVVITGTASSANNRTNSTSVATVSKEDLTRRPSNNIIDAISRVPGVSQVTTGAAISKPIIRGLGSNRILTLSDGVKQEGQQWGDEHGIEIDQYNAERVEILRGAASLLYGSDALGGVINIIDDIPPTDGNVRGELLSNYAGNNGLSSNSAMLEGNKKGFIWQGRGTYKNAFSYNTADGRIPNTAFNERNFSGLLGLNKKWGYTHLNLSSFNQKLGLPDFERNASGKFEDSEGEVFSESQLKSRNLLLPFQDVRHYKAALNSQLLLNSGRLRSIIAFQNNQRRELEDSATDPSLFFDLKTYSYDFKYYFEENNGWEPVIGMSGAFQNSKNRAGEFLVPDYDNRDFGAFGYLKKTWTKTTFNAGIRFDSRTISGIEMEEDGVTKFQNFENTFSNISGAIGSTHELNDNWSLKANLGSAFRAPNIAELSSDGVHEGTFRYELGNPNLKPERSLYADAALEFHSTKLDFHFNLFNNYIGNYIYARQIDDPTIDIEDAQFLFSYVQDNANLYGTEIELNLHPTSYLHVENSFSLTRGQNAKTKNNLPLIPAPRLRNELRFEPDIKSDSFKNTYFSIGMENVFKQDKVDYAFDETPTPSYTLIDASAGTTLKFKKQPVRIYISANNLFDKAFVDHLNRLKYVGFFNQGRNIAFGLQLPFNF